ncbi:MULTISPECIES: LPS translocon maturation chaperone LptM [Spiribacter]|jgi:predicted small lipoprotein YifL|nr:MULTISPECIES: lipoprotein [Spiribacter]
MSLRILPCLALITLILLTGCGVKGDLYLPEADTASDAETAS